MDVDPLASDLPPTENQPDDELFVQGLPQLFTRCATITVSGKHVLKKAAKKLGVLIHGFDTASLGGDDIAVSVSMDVPPHPGNPTMKAHTFYGEWARFHSEAKESACMAALTYLKQQGLIEVHDIHFAELEECKKRYKTEQFWSSMLYDRVLALQKQLPATASISSVNHPKQESSDGKNKSTPISKCAGSATCLNSLEKKPKTRGACRKELFPPK